MPQRQYGRLEEHIIDVFKKDRLFTYQNKIYEVMIQHSSVHSRFILFLKVI